MLPQLLVWLLSTTLLVYNPQHEVSASEAVLSYHQMLVALALMSSCAFVHWHEGTEQSLAPSLCWKDTFSCPRECAPRADHPTTSEKPLALRPLP